MKKNIFKFSLVLFVSLFLMISCENNSLSGILSDVVNSESKVDYRISQFQKGTLAAVSIESDGIYKNTYNLPSFSGFSQKEKLKLEGINFNLVKKVYVNNNDLYVLTSTDLYYVDITSIDNTPVKIDMGDDLTVMDISTSNDSTVSSAYLVCGNYDKTSEKTTLKFFVLDSTLDSTVGAVKTIELAKGEIYINLVDTDKGNGYIFILNTFKDNKYNYHYLEFGTTPKETKLSEGQECPIVSFYRSNLNNKVIIVLKENGDLWAYNKGKTSDKFYKINASTIPMKLRNNTYLMYEETADFAYLVLKSSEQDNYLLAYKIKYNINDNSNYIKSVEFQKINLGYAKGLSNASRIVYIENVGSHQFIVVTESSGYYTVEVDPSKVLINDDLNGRYDKKIHLVSF